MTRRPALLTLCFALAGCASTSGREWLNTPIDEHVEAASVSQVPAPAGTDSRPRLSHTVTLGESYDLSEPAAAGPVGAPPVQVSVTTHVPVVVNNYAAYGYGYYPSSFSGPATAPVRAAHSTETKVGADFPAPPDYGPRALK
jgi:hypothetical protein